MATQTEEVKKPAELVGACRVKTCRCTAYARWMRDTHGWEMCSCDHTQKSHEPR